MSMFRRLIAVGLLGCLGTPFAAASTGTAAVAPVVLSMPRPTGPYAVGVRSASVSDPTRIDEQTGRPRRLPLRVWYPAAQNHSGRSAPYLSPAVQNALETELSFPTGLLTIDTHAAADVRSRRHVAGIVLVQHGGGTIAAFGTALVVDLASRGYAVVTMDHPHESLVVEEPDGTLIYGVPNPDTRPFQERIDDASVVLAALSRLVPEADRRTPVAMIGHSRGGAASAEIMVHHPQVVAGVDIDGSPRGEVVAAGLDQPLGLMLSLDQPLENNPLLAEFLGNLRGPHPVHQLPIHHYGYTDWVVFNRQATMADPALGAYLEGLLLTGTANTPHTGEHALAAQRQFLARFMTTYLR